MPAESLSTIAYDLELPKRSITERIEGKLDKIRAFFRPNEEEARQLVERVALRIEDRERENRKRGIFGPQEKDIDPEVLGKLQRLYGVPINIATHQFTSSEHKNLVGEDNELYGEVSKFRKIVLIASTIPIATSLLGPFLQGHPQDLTDRENITRLAGPASNSSTYSDGPEVITVETRDMHLLYPSEGSEIDVEVFHPGACAITLYERDGDQWVEVGTGTSGADVLRLERVPADFGIGSDNCSPNPDSPIPLEMFEGSVAIHMAALLAALGFVDSDPNNVQELRAIGPKVNVRLAIVDIDFPENMGSVADFTGTDLLQLKPTSGLNDSDDTLLSSHGINVASRVAGFATGVVPTSRVALIGFGDAAKTLPNGGYALKDGYFVAGLDSALNNADVVCVSLARTGGEGELAASNYRALFERARDEGKFLVLAAGNTERDAGSLMQIIGMEYPNVLVVGGIGPMGAISTLAGELYANDGDGALFPILSSGYSPDTGDTFSGRNYVADNYKIAKGGGSSYAAPVVAGAVVAMLSADPSLRYKPEDVHRILRDTSGEFGVDVAAAYNTARLERFGRAIEGTPKMQNRSGIGE